MTADIKIPIAASSPCLYTVISRRLYAQQITNTSRLLHMAKKQFSRLPALVGNPHLKTKVCTKRLLNSQFFEPVTSQYPCDALTNCVMKPLTLGAGHQFSSLLSMWGQNSWVTVTLHLCKHSLDSILDRNSSKQS